MPEGKFIITNGKTGVKKTANNYVTCPVTQATPLYYKKACNVLRSLPKTLKQFDYKVEPIHIPVESLKPSSDIKTVIESKGLQICTEAKTWLDRIVSLSNLAKDARARQIELCIAQSELDKRKVNLEHDIELTEKVNACDGYKKYKELKNLLEERRKVKDELFVVGTILGSKLDSIADESVEKSTEKFTNRKFTYR